MGNYLDKKKDNYIPYYTVFDIKEQKQDIPMEKKNSYYTTICKNYNSIKLHGIEILK